MGEIGWPCKWEALLRCIGTREVELLRRAGIAGGFSQWHTVVWVGDCKALAQLFLLL